MEYSDIRSGLADISGPPERLLNRLILEAIKDLSEKTWVYTETLPFLTTAGTDEYTITPTVSTDLILGVSHEGVQKATINTPQPSATDGTSAGTLTAGTTYYYKVTANVDSHRETLPCAVVSHECPATGSIVLTWTAISGADSYNVYGRTTALYGLMEEETTSVTYTDDGTDTPGSDTPPTTSNLMRDIDVSNLIDEKRGDRYWRSTESDSFNRIIFDGKATIKLNTIPVTSGIGFQIKVALEPTVVTASDLPTIFDKYKETIRDFVRWKLYVMGVTETITWPNPQLGVFYRGIYMRTRDELKFRVMGGFGGELRAEPQFF